MVGAESNQPATSEENSTKREKSKEETDETKRRNPVKKEEQDKAVKIRRKSAGKENHPAFVE